jgi:hypothetical protein
MRGVEPGVTRSFGVLRLPEMWARVSEAVMKRRHIYLFSGFRSCYEEAAHLSFFVWFQKLLWRGGTFIFFFWFQKLLWRQCQGDCATIRGGFVKKKNTNCRNKRLKNAKIGIEHCFQFLLSKIRFAIGFQNLSLQKNLKIYGRFLQKFDDL